MRHLLICLAVVGCITAAAPAVEEIKPSDSVLVRQGAISGAIISRNGRMLVVYGDPAGFVRQPDMVLFTDARRDVAWAGQDLVAKGARAVVPAAVAERFTDPDAFWSAFRRKRFHDYDQQGTKLPVEPMPVSMQVSDGHKIQWQDLEIEVVATPGYTREGVSYLTTIDNLKYAFVGDLMYRDGRLFDLYSLQDAVADAQIGGYHGWAGRLGDLMASLRKIAERKPDVIVPAHGWTIYKTAEEIALLIHRLQAVYENYLSINAGRWYFKERYGTLAARVLGPDAKVDWMTWAPVIEQRPPAWVIPIQNSRLILSADRSGFLLDCGSPAIIAEIEKLQAEGRLSHISGMFITHYHDDHTNSAADLAARFDCPVYCSWQQRDILANPSAYRLPCLTANPIPNAVAVPSGHKMRWKEYGLTLFYHPGQTIYHDALLVEPDADRPIFFMGDSFTPSGIDDYCLLNRNLLHNDTGYLYCLDALKTLPENCLLVNQHVTEPFRFSTTQIEHMQRKLRQRKQLLAELFPWDEPNYGIDERWARFYPYGRTAKRGDRVQLGVRVFNHSAQAQEYAVTLNTPPDIEGGRKTASVRIDPRKEAELLFDVRVAATAAREFYVVTADVQFSSWDLRRWCEAIIEIEPPAR